MFILAFESEASVNNGRAVARPPLIPVFVVSSDLASFPALMSKYFWTSAACWAVVSAPVPICTVRVFWALRSDSCCFASFSALC